MKRGRVQRWRSSDWRQRRKRVDSLAVSPGLAFADCAWYGAHSTCSYSPLGRVLPCRMPVECAMSNMPALPKTSMSIQDTLRLSSALRPRCQHSVDSVQIMLMLTMALAFRITPSLSHRPCPIGLLCVVLTSLRRIIVRKRLIQMHRLLRRALLSLPARVLSIVSCACMLFPAVNMSS